MTTTTIEMRREPEIDAGAIRPSRRLYAIPIAVVVVGLALCVFMIGRGAGATPGQNERAVGPGTQNVGFPTAGTYTIYFEAETIPGDTTNTAIRDFPNLKLSISSATTGQQLALTPSTRSTSYRIFGGSPVSVMQFQVKQPGQYTVHAEYPNGQKGPPFVLSITYGAVGMVVGYVLVGFGLLFVGIAVAGALAGLIYYRRRSAARYQRLGLV